MNSAYDSTLPKKIKCSRAKTCVLKTGKYYQRVENDAKEGKIVQKFAELCQRLPNNA